MRDGGERGPLLAASRRAAEAEPGQQPPHHPRVARWPVLVIAAVVAAGVFDGAARAVSERCARRLRAAGRRCGDVCGGGVRAQPHVR